MHHVSGVVEIAHSHVLNLHHYGIEPLKFFRGELDVVGERSEFSVPRGKDSGEIAPFPEQFIHIIAPCSVPAVLGAETSNPAFKQGLVQLVFQRCCSE